MGAVRRVWGEWTLDAFWMSGDATFTLGSLRRGNQDFYRFEERLGAR